MVGRQLGACPDPSASVRITVCLSDQASKTQCLERETARGAYAAKEGCLQGHSKVTRLAPKMTSSSYNYTTTMVPV